ncbi:unnamed protein product [Amoebophrya sp. A120]|nr:unnamed protein product [Amoebophrya sp. A120]|eukprot:GSA120T00020065001.1
MNEQSESAGGAEELSSSDAVGAEEEEDAAVDIMSEPPAAAELDVDEGMNDAELREDAAAAAEDAATMLEKGECESGLLPTSTSSGDTTTGEVACSCDCSTWNSKRDQVFKQKTEYSTLHPHELQYHVQPLDLKKTPIDDKEGRGDGKIHNAQDANVMTLHATQLMTSISFTESNPFPGKVHLKPFPVRQYDSVNQKDRLRCRGRPHTTRKMTLNDAWKCTCRHHIRISSAGAQSSAGKNAAHHSLGHDVAAKPAATMAETWAAAMENHANDLLRFAQEHVARHQKRDSSFHYDEKTSSFDMDIFSEKDSIPYFVTSATTNNKDVQMNHHNHFFEEIGNEKVTIQAGTGPNHLFIDKPGKDIHQTSAETHPHGSHKFEFSKFSCTLVIHVQKTLSHHPHPKTCELCGMGRHIHPNHKKDHNQDSASAVQQLREHQVNHRHIELPLYSSQCCLTVPLQDDEGKVTGYQCHFAFGEEDLACRLSTQTARSCRASTSTRNRTTSLKVITSRTRSVITIKSTRTQLVVVKALRLVRGRDENEVTNDLVT